MKMNSVMNFNADKLRTMLDRTDTPIIIDVRSKREYLQAHIPGAIHLPFWQIMFRYKILLKFRKSNIVVYCEHGPRAVFARQILQAKGFLSVQFLEGHMLGWRRSGFPLQKK
jgi:hydroxyacylglutathione hydrolase